MARRACAESATTTLTGVQIIEQTGFGVRSAVFTLASKTSETRFVVVPMLHIGEPSFYRAVQRTLLACDKIVVEGVGGRRVSALTLSYRIASRFGRGGLVMQGRALDLSPAKDRLIRPDLTAAQFSSGWKRLAIPLRWPLLIVAPLIGLWMLIIGPRRMFAQIDRNLDDLPLDLEEEMSEGFTGPLDELIVDARDRALCAALSQLAQSGHAQTVGICWGAEHARAVMKLLRRQFDYRIVDATWITVSAW